MKLVRHSVTAITMATLAALMLLLSPVNAYSQDFIKCESAIESSLKTLKPIAQFVGSFSENQCLNREGLLENTPRFLGHTLSDMVDYEHWAFREPEVETSSTLVASISGGIELLAYRIDLVRFMVNVMLTSPEQFRSTQLSTQEDWQRTYGGFASILAKADFMAGLMPYLVQNLLASDHQLPTDEGDIVLQFNLQSESAGIDIDTVLDSTIYLNSESGANFLDVLNLEQVTVRISNGPVDGSAEFDPTDWSLERGELGLNLDLGPNTITSTTVFSKGHGVERQSLRLTAQLGNIDLFGEATFAQSSQEFKLQANVADLLTVSTLTFLTPQGLSTPSVGFILNIPIEKSD